MLHLPPFLCYAFFCKSGDLCGSISSNSTNLAILILFFSLCPIGGAQAIEDWDDESTLLACRLLRRWVHLLPLDHLSWKCQPDVDEEEEEGEEEEEIHVDATFCAAVVW